MLVFVVFTNCEENEITPKVLEIDYVGFESGFILGVDPTGTAEQEIKIATSNKTTSDRTFNLVVDSDLTTADASAYSVPNSVTVPANSNIGVFNIAVIGEYIDPSGDDILAIGFSSNDNNVFVSGSISLNLKQVCPNPELILDITFDPWPEEIFWRLLDSSGNTLFASANLAYGAYAGLSGGITKPMCLANGSYTFEIYDQFGDGAGPFSLTYDGSVVFSSDGGYGPGTSHTFTLP